MFPESSQDVQNIGMLREHSANISGILRAGWHSDFIPGNQNPTDLCTRYIPFSILKDGQIWFYGPQQSNQFIKYDAK